MKFLTTNNWDCLKFALIDSNSNYANCCLIINYCVLTLAFQKRIRHTSSFLSTSSPEIRPPPSTPLHPSPSTIDPVSSPPLTTTACCYATTRISVRMRSSCVRSRCSTVLTDTRCVSRFGLAHLRTTLTSSQALPSTSSWLAHGFDAGSAGFGRRPQCR